MPVFSISASDFVEMFVGVGASCVRDLFEQGKKHAPCIVFVDEIDASAGTEGPGSVAGTMNGSRRSISSSSKWTDSSRTRV